MRRIGKAATSKVAVRKDLGVRVPLPPQRNKSQSDLNVAGTFKFLKEIYYVPQMNLQTKTIAVVGLSDKIDRPSFKVAKYFLDLGC